MHTLSKLDTILIDHDLDLPVHNPEIDIMDEEWGMWADELEAALSGNREEFFVSGEIDIVPKNVFDSAQVLPVCVSHCGIVEFIY